MPPAPTMWIGFTPPTSLPRRRFTPSLLRSCLAFHLLVPKLCLGTPSWKLCFPSGRTSRETEFRRGGSQTEFGNQERAGASGSEPPRLGAARSLHFWLSCLWASSAFSRRVRFWLWASLAIAES